MNTISPEQPGRRRSGRKSAGRFTGAQWWAVCGLCFVLALAFIFSVIATARLSDREEIIKEAQTAYERKVYRTTVKYRELIVSYAREYGLRPAFLAAIILNESSYDPYALVERTGARGLMQLLPSAAETYKRGTRYEGRSLSENDLFDPQINICIGANYVRILSDRYGGDPVLVACAYHAGPNNVDYWLFRSSADGKTLDPDEIPKADTRQYAKKVVDSYVIYQTHYYPD